MTYAEFLAGKAITAPTVGIESPRGISKALFPFQQAIVKIALRRGKCAIFAGTGLGKTPMQCEWARHVEHEETLPVLIFAPLAVTKQTIAEARKILGMEVRAASSQADVAARGVYITNYQKLHLFNPKEFGGVVLDESSIIKNEDGAFRTALIEAFRATRFKLACTATPAPNDFMEIGNHADFLDSMSMSEMLSTFFVHDGGSTQDWRLKGHAEADFWKWMASWCVCLQMPSDLGFDDAGYVLPKLNVYEHAVESGVTQDGDLFPMESLTMSERRSARKNSIEPRVSLAYDIVNKSWHTTQNIISNTELLTANQSTREHASGTPTIASESKPRPENMPHLIEKKNEHGKMRISPPITKSDLLTCESGMQKSVIQFSNITESEGRSAQIKSAIGISAQNTELPLFSITKSSKDKEEDAQYAESMDGSDSMSITVTQRNLSEESCVNRVIKASGDSKTVQSHCDGRQITSREKWVIWCGLNSEQNAIAKLLGNKCVSVFGDLSEEEKIARYSQFERGEVDVLVSKIAIFGFGLNMQFSRNSIFLGMSDSFEGYYQGVRRQWRFGQVREVHAHIVIADTEGAVLRNIKRKQSDAEKMQRMLVEHMAALTKKEIAGSSRAQTAYEPKKTLTIPDWITQNVNNSIS